MRRKKTLLISVILSVFVAASASFFGVDSGIVAHAVAKSAIQNKTGDLVKKTMHKGTEFDEITIDGQRKRVLNSKNLNTDVATGVHYEMLDETEKILYRAFAAAGSHVYPYGTTSYQVKLGDDGLIPLSIYEKTQFQFSSNQFQDAYEAVRYDYPDMVQLTMTDIQFKYQSIKYSSTGEQFYNSYVYLVAADSSYTQEKFDQMSQQIRSKKEEILSDSKIIGAKGIIGRELAIHDKLMEMNVYDDACADSNISEHLGHTAYGSLVQGHAVCDGYSIAFSYLLDGINVDSMVVGGEANGGGHAWNMVKQDGDWYEVDVTWDDDDEIVYTSVEEERDTRHLFYHLTTAQISNYSYSFRSKNYTSKRKRTGFSLNFPSANGTKYSWSKVKELLDNAAEVQVHATDVSVNPVSISSSVGTKAQVTATVLPNDATNKKVHFNSSDDNVITIDENGNYEVVGSGNAIISVITDDGGITKKIAVNIPDKNGVVKVTGISVFPNTIEGAVGETGLIEFNISPSNAENQNVAVSVSNEKVVSVSKKYGTSLYYTIIGKGSSTIKVTTEDGGYEGICTINVPLPKYTVRFDANGGTINGASYEDRVYEEETVANSSDVQVPVREGYTFAGWYDASAGGNVFVSRPVTEGFTVYAHWTLVEQDTNIGNNDSDTNGNNSSNSSTNQKEKDDPNKAKITQNKKEIKLSKLKKKDQKVTVEITKSKGKITVKNTTAKKLKKYLKLKVKGRKVICTLKKGAKKGTYKVKITVAKKGKYKKTEKTIKIVVK